MNKYMQELPEYHAPIRNSNGVVNTDVVKWSGKEVPPAIGALINVRMNGLGEGTVKGYFIDANWLGVTVKLHSPPEWWVKQNAADLNRLAHIFGAEIHE